MGFRRWTKLLVTFGAGVFMAILVIFTYDAGRGVCEECGHTRKLFGCRHRDLKMCYQCWYGHSTCPRCGMRP